MAQTFKVGDSIWAVERKILDRLNQLLPGTVDTAFHVNDSSWHIHRRMLAVLNMASPAPASAELFRPADNVWQIDRKILQRFNDILGTTFAPSQADSRWNFARKILQALDAGAPAADNADVFSPSASSLWRIYFQILDRLNDLTSLGGGSGPVAPPAPTSLDILGTSTSASVKLAWTQTSAPQFNEIWKSVNGSAYSLLQTVAGTVTTFSDSAGIPTNTFWAYQIRANTNGLTSSFTTPAELAHGIIHDADGTTNMDRPNLVVVIDGYYFFGGGTPKPFSSMKVPRLHDVLDTMGGSTWLGIGETNGNFTMDWTGVVNAAFLSLDTNTAYTGVVNLPSLTTMTESGVGLEIVNCAHLTSVSAPNFTTCQGIITIDNDPALISITLSSLQFLGQDLDCSGNALLTALSLPVLTSVGSLGSAFFANAYFGAGINGTVGVATPLTSIIIPGVIFTNGMAIDFQGCALGAASINQILRRAVVSGLTTAVITLQGGTNAAPSGQGVADKAALIAAGNTVTTN